MRNPIIAERGKLRSVADLRETFEQFQQLDRAAADVRRTTESMRTALGCSRAEAAKLIGPWATSAETRELGFAKRFVWWIETGPWIPNKNERRALLSQVTGMERDALRVYIADVKRELETGTRRKRKR